MGRFTCSPYSRFGIPGGLIKPNNFIVNLTQIVGICVYDDGRTKRFVSGILLLPWRWESFFLALSLIGVGADFFASQSTCFLVISSSAGRRTSFPDGMQYHLYLVFGRVVSGVHGGSVPVTPFVTG
jgi:hypothetical protein